MYELHLNASVAFVATHSTFIFHFQMRHCVCHYSLVHDTQPALEIVYRLMTE